MSDATSRAPAPADLAHLHAVFLADILPRVEQHGRVYFRHLKCLHAKEEALAEMRALAWLSSMLLMAPSPALLARLPNNKLPDRKDFYHYGIDHAAREAAWHRAMGECQRMADEFARWAENPDLSVVLPL